MRHIEPHGMFNIPGQFKVGKPQHLGSWLCTAVYFFSALGLALIGTAGTFLGLTIADYKPQPIRTNRAVRS